MIVFKLANNVIGFILFNWECPKKDCDTINPQTEFKCTACGFNSFLDQVIKNALWLTLLKFAIDIFLINVLNADKTPEYFELSASANVIMLVFFGIINVVQITLKFNTNLNLIRSFMIGVITSLVLIFFFVVVVNAYNILMSMTMTGYVYAFGLDYNMISPLAYCILGSIIGGVYSNWLYKPVVNNLATQK